MATKLVQDSSLTAIADAIRAKSGTSAALTFPSGFASAIADIPTGGGGVDAPTFTIVFDDNYATIISATCDKTFSEVEDLINYDGVEWALVRFKTQNDEGIASGANLDGYRATWDSFTYVMTTDGLPNSIVTYSSNGTVQLSPADNLVSLTATSNGTYTPNHGQAYNEVTVNVPSSSPTLQTKTKTYTPTESQQTEAITADSGYDGLSEVDVTVNAVSSTYVGTGITRRSSTDLTASGATVTVPSGYYSAQASKAVSSGSAGTPTATKGTVSNHSVSITPSVTNTTGYITGGTKTGTAVSVSASELVSGSETKTANGTYDVTNLASLIVNVSGGGGSGLEYEEGTYSPSSDVARLTVSFANSHSKVPAFIVFADATNTSDTTSNSNWVWIWVDYYRWFGGGLSFGSSSYRYASSLVLYRGSSTSTLSTATVHCTYNSDSSVASGTSYPRYWATETEFHPYTNSTSRYWRSGRTYKWIAVWK